MEKHIPVPVIAAKEIAEKYRKTIVVICSYDPISNLVHTTTYGIPGVEKTIAADWGVIAAKALGCDLSQQKIYEDFRKGKEKKT